MAKLKVLVAMEITIDEAKKIFGEEFEHEYKEMKPNTYSNPGDYVVTQSGLVLVTVEE